MMAAFSEEQQQPSCSHQALNSIAIKASMLSSHQELAERRQRDKNMNNSIQQQQQQQQQQQLCVLPAQHAQNHLQRFIFGQERFFANNDSQPETKPPPPTISETTSGHLQSMNDPYIDVVQVRYRPGDRRRTTLESQPSYYKKVVHVEEKKDDKQKWNVKHDSYDSSDYDSDDSDDDDDDADHHKHHKKGKKKKKRVYVKYPKQKTKKKRKRKKHHYSSYGKHHHDHHHHHDYHHKKQKKREPEGKKVKVYKARVVYDHPPKEDKYHHDHGYDDHDHHHHYEKGGGGGGGDDKHAKVKLVYLDNNHHHHKHHGGGGSGKYATNKMRLAGVLGYTLLCVNYLLVARQSSHHHHHKYANSDEHGHYFSSYSPLDHGKVMKSSGPVILAHCSEIPDSSLLASPSSPSRLNSSASSNQQQQQLQKQSTDLANRLAASTDHYYSLFSTSSSSAAANQVAARSPPAFYYTLSTTTNYHQPAAGGGGRSFISSSPIQDYLNRILLPTSGSLSSQQQQQQQLDGQSDLEQQQQPQLQIQAVPRRNQNNLRLLQDPNNGPLVGNIRNSRLVLLDNGQPQVVGTRDNLAGLRTRQANISLRITNRNRFAAGPQQQNMRLVIGGDPVTLDPSGDDTAGMQADQPTADNNGGGGSSSPSNNLVLDLPEFALAGDSIQLNCNHRIPMQRLYSVKWFKDSFEFYRFVPANGPRSKSSLFLPDVRLDMARSNSESLYLRNVTHRSSGLYRCEAVSEGPNFDMVSGERRMQVYALPESGPSMSLVERAELPPVSTPPPLGPLLATPNAAIIRGQNAIVLGSGQRERELSNGQDDDDTDDSRMLGPQLQRQRTISGPIVQCKSARSSPAAQLRLSINDRPLESGRTIENSTESYSDGTESNMVAFRISMDDFRALLDSEDTNRLDKAAASLKSNSSLSATTTSSTTTTTTSTTTTSTTPRPAKQTMKSAKSRQPPNANANVMFDDDSLKLDRKRQRQPANADRKKISSGGGQKRKDQVTGGGGGRSRLDAENSSEPADEEEQDDRAAAAAASQQLHHHQALDLARLPAGKDKQQQPANQQHEQQNLVGMEQRSIGATRSRPQAATAAAAASYSNFIRVKCTSLVPAVGYEMTSELSVPITLLVPARQLQPTSQSSSAVAAADQVGVGEDGSRRLTGVGGSLQAPRAVLIDRLAQASGPNLVERLSPAANNNSSSPPTKGSHQVLRHRDRTKQPAAALSQRLSARPNGSSSNNNNNIRPSVSSKSQLSPLDTIRGYFSFTSHQLVLCLLATIWNLQHQSAAFAAAAANRHSGSQQY